MMMMIIIIIIIIDDDDDDDDDDNNNNNNHNNNHNNNNNKNNSNNDMYSVKFYESWKWIISWQRHSQDFKMPFQNSNSKISAHPDLATNLL